MELSGLSKDELAKLALAGVLASLDINPANLAKMKGDLSDEFFVKALLDQGLPPGKALTKDQNSKSCSEELRLNVDTMLVTRVKC